MWNAKGTLTARERGFWQNSISNRDFKGCSIVFDQQIHRVVANQTLTRHRIDMTKNLRLRKQKTDNATANRCGRRKRHREMIRKLVLKTRSSDNVTSNWKQKSIECKQAFKGQWHKRVATEL